MLKQGVLGALHGSRRRRMYSLHDDVDVFPYLAALFGG